jgi:hypothetical protein
LQNYDERQSQNPQIPEKTDKFVLAFYFTQFCGLLRILKKYSRADKKKGKTGRISFLVHTTIFFDFA